jgi:inosose dehydratase
MNGTVRVGFNPLPWYLTERGPVPDAASPVKEIYRQIKAAGFDAVHVEVPEHMGLAEYRALLDDAGLAAAPGYFQAPWSDPNAVPPAVAAAARTAAQHAELGLSRIFIADQFGAEPRTAAPAVGAGFSQDRLSRIIDNLAVAASAMVAEGVTPCLHQHVGTWIETPEETAAVLAGVDPRVLMLGPDTGHLAWAGADPTAFIGRYRDRVGAVHLKDLRARVRTEGLAAGWSYPEITGRHVFTEPGRGDVDLDAVLGVLAGFDGWYVVEVDIADQPTPEETARVSARWVRRHLAGRS